MESGLREGLPAGDGGVGGSDAGQPEGGGTAGRTEGGDPERSLAHRSHPGPGSFAPTGRGLDGAWPAVTSRPHPQPQRPPDPRESDPRAPRSPDPPSDARTRPWSHCCHYSASLSPPRTWRGLEVRRPLTPAQTPRRPGSPPGLQPLPKREPRDPLASAGLGPPSSAREWSEGASGRWVLGTNNAGRRGNLSVLFPPQREVGALGVWI